MGCFWPVLVLLGVDHHWAARPPADCSTAVHWSPGAASPGGEPPLGSSPLGGFGCFSLVSHGAGSLPAGGEPPAGVSPLEAGLCRTSASRLSARVSHWWYPSGWSSFSICCWSSVAWLDRLPLGSLLTMSCIVMFLRGLPSSSRWGRKVRSRTLVARRGGSIWYCWTYRCCRLLAMRTRSWARHCGVLSHRFIMGGPADVSQHIAEECLGCLAQK